MQEKAYDKDKQKTGDMVMEQTPTKLVIEENTLYEIDLTCAKAREERQRRERRRKSSARGRTLGRPAGIRRK